MVVRTFGRDRCRVLQRYCIRVTHEHQLSFFYVLRRRAAGAGVDGGRAVGVGVRVKGEQGANA
jgi:hypothetical protein